MLLRHFCVDIINKEKKWFVRRGSFVFHRCVISALAQRRLGKLERPWSTYHLHVLVWLHKRFYLDLNIGWTASLPRLYGAVQSVDS